MVRGCLVSIKDVRIKLRKINPCPQNVRIDSNSCPYGDTINLEKLMLFAPKIRTSTSEEPLLFAKCLHWTNLLLLTSDPFSDSLLTVVYNRSVRVFSIVLNLLLAHHNPDGSILL